MSARLHLNRWGIKVRAGYVVKYHTARSGLQSGTVAHIRSNRWQVPSGSEWWEVTLVGGGTCALDDVTDAGPGFPRIERGCPIEVARPRNCRPGYAWVQGWVVHYSETRTSEPIRLREARDMLRSETFIAKKA